MDLISTGIKTASMLFIVLGFLVMVLFLIKKFISPKQRIKGDVVIKVLSSLYLSPKERVEVVEILGERMVLGITPGNINLLTKLNHLNDGGTGKHNSEKKHEIKHEKTK